MTQNWNTCLLWPNQTKDTRMHWKTPGCWSLAREWTGSWRLSPPVRWSWNVYMKSVCLFLPEFHTPYLVFYLNLVMLTALGRFGVLKGNSSSILSPSFSSGQLVSYLLVVIYHTNKYLTSQISNVHQSYPDSPRTRRPWLGQCCSREPQGGVSSGSPVATC